MFSAKQNSVELLWLCGQTNNRGQLSEHQWLFPAAIFFGLGLVACSALVIDDGFFSVVDFPCSILSFCFFFSCFSLSPFVLVVSFTTTQHQHHQSTLRWYISISRPHDSISELTESVHLRKFHLKSETNTQMSLWLDEWSKHNFDEYYCLCYEKTQTYNGALFVTGHAHTNTNTHKHTDDARAIAKRDSGPDLRLIHTCQNSSTTQNNCLLGFICLLRCRWQFSHLTMHCWHSL